MRNYVANYMNKVNKPSVESDKRAIKTKEIDIEIARLELDSYTDSSYDEESLNTLENEGEE